MYIYIYIYIYIYTCGFDPLNSCGGRDPRPAASEMCEVCDDPDSNNNTNTI